MEAFHDLFLHGKVCDGSMKRIWCERTFKIYSF